MLTPRRRGLAIALFLALLGSTAALTAPAPAQAVDCSATAALPTVFGSGDYRLRDNLELGDFRRWSSKTAEGDARVYVGTARTVSGACAGRIVVTSSWNSKGNVRKWLPSTTRDVSLSGWFRVDKEGAWGSNVPTFRLFLGNQRIADVYRQNGTGDLWLRTSDGSGGWRYRKLGRRIGLGTWYRIELHVYANWSGSDIGVRVNGTLVYQNWSHWLPVGRLDNAMVGAEHRRQVMDLWFDDIAIRSS